MVGWVNKIRFGNKVAMQVSPLDPPSAQGLGLEDEQVGDVGGGDGVGHGLDQWLWLI